METPIEVEDQNQEKNQGTGAEKDFVNEGSENKDENVHGTRSLIWEHFTYVKGQTKFKCPYCKKMLKYVSKNGTQGLKNHLENTCRTSPLFKKTKGDTKKQSVLSLKPTVKGEGSLTAHSFSEENCRKALAKMCIKDNRPFSVVDDEGFKEYSLELNPLFKIPSRWSVARDCLAIYKEEANVVKNLFEKSNGLSMPQEKPKIHRTDVIPNRTTELPNRVKPKLYGIKYNKPKFFGMVRFYPKTVPYRTMHTPIGHKMEEEVIGFH